MPLALRVSTLLVAVGFGLNDALIPLGGYAVSVTLDEKPFMPMTEIVEEAEDP